MSLILKIYENTLKINDWPKFQNCFWNILARKYHSKMVQYSKRTFGCQVSNETDPNHGGFLFLEKKTVTIMQCFKVFLKDYTVVFACFFSRNQNRPWLGSVSFENWHPKVRFEYWTIFEGYFRAEIFQKQFWTFGQSLIFNVFFRKEDILSTLKMSLKGDLNTSFMWFIGQIGNGRVCSLRKTCQ